MDFLVGLPRTAKGYYSIWVILDRLTKSAHFLPVYHFCSMFISIPLFNYHTLNSGIVINNF